MNPPPSSVSVLCIAVISDTHDRCPPDLLGRLAAADEIWHLGDVCDPSTLAELEWSGKPLRIVRGNNDWNPGWPFVLRLVRGGRTFHLEHIAPRRAPPGTAFVLSGHTHVPSDVTDATGIRWLNPGCLTRPRAQVLSFAWLRVASDGAVDWTLERL